MVNVPEGVIHSMGRSDDDIEARRLRDTVGALAYPRYSRIEFPMMENDARLRRFADDLHGLANQIAFITTRFDLHMHRRLVLIHSEVKALNYRWKRETGVGGKSTDKSVFMD